jgi:hypothetical protein
MSGTERPAELDLRLEGDERFLAGLLRGERVADAARSAGLSEATGRRRLGNADFCRRLDQGRRELTSLLALEMTRSAGVAHEVLMRIASDETASPTARVRAASSLLAAAVKIAEQVDLRSDLVRRLEELEGLAVVREHRPSRRLLDGGA